MYQLGMDRCPLASGLETCVKAEDGPVKGVQRRALEMVRGRITKGERLEELGLCSLQKRRFKGQRIVVPFAKACSGKARGSVLCRLKMGRFRFGIRMICFTMRVLRHWNRLSRKVVYAPPWKCLKARWVGWCFQPLDVVKNVPPHPKRVGL